MAITAAGVLAVLLTLAAIVGDRVAVTSWVPALDRWAYDIRLQAAARELPNALQIVGIDGLAESGEPAVSPELLGGFVQRVREAGASVIVLDVQAIGLTGDNAADSALASVLAERDDIVLTADVVWTEVQDGLGGVTSVQEPSLPLPLFDEVASGVGVASLSFDPDSSVRRAQPQSHILGVPYWSLAVEVVRVHQGVPLEGARLVDGVLELGASRFETGNHYYIDQHQARPPFSLENLMRLSELPARARPMFEGAIVLVGPVGPGAETVSTPLSESAPKVFVEASNIATLIGNRMRHNAPLAFQVLLIWFLAFAGAGMFFNWSLRTALLIWPAGWGLLALLFWLPFEGGLVFSVAAPTLAWGLIFPLALGYRLHASGVDILARDRSIQTIAKLRDVRFEEMGLPESLLPLFDTLGGALDAHSVLLLQEGGEYWEVVSGIGAPPQDWSQLRRAVSSTNGEMVLGRGGREAFVPITIDQDNRRRVLYVRGSRSLGPLDTHTLLSVTSGLHLGFQNRALTRRLEEAYLGILTAIGVAVEARDEATEAHCQRLATYSCELAAELSYPDDFIEDLWIGAALHDIGKVGVPDAVFHKPGALTPKEFELMKQHTVLGYRILEDAPISETAKLCVLHHHERWDGKGYPDGLAGEDIPRSARIVSVLDTFDALTSDRSYRPGKDEREAVEYVRSESGGALEPDLVECFMSLHTEGIIRGAGEPIPDGTRLRWSPRRERTAGHLATVIKRNGA
jgi:HD-GYP domain-containing protein (c-di-GMP phosphodiesterase class II)/CHASE2 domain-containing sensor protein